MNVFFKTLIVVTIANIASLLLTFKVIIPFIYNMEISDKRMQETLSSIESYKNDTELNQCTKNLFDKNLKVTRKSLSNYNDCISGIERKRAEQKLRQILGVEQ